MSSFGEVLGHLMKKAILKGNPTNYRRSKRIIPGDLLGPMKKYSLRRSDDILADDIMGKNCKV